MKAIEKLRSALEGDVFSEAELEIVLGPGEARYSSLKRLLKAGDLVRLRRGLYAFGAKHRKRQLAPLVIANILYGPSYVSLHSMLSYYGLIPEAVVEVTSVNTKKTKLYNTNIGRFRYRIIPANAFPHGVCTISESLGTFIGATKEKALLDTLYLARTTHMLDYVTQSLRVEVRELTAFDLEKVIELADDYNNKVFLKRISQLVKDLR